MDDFAPERITTINWVHPKMNVAVTCRVSPLSSPSPMLQAPRCFVFITIPNNNPLFNIALFYRNFIKKAVFHLYLLPVFKDV